MKTAFAFTLLLASPQLIATATKTSDGFFRQAVGQLESSYIEDCETDKTPHGFYGAFLEPCEFAFFQNSLDSSDPCGEDSEQVGSSVPMNWVLNLTEHMKKNDWDSSFDWDKMSSDDLPSPEDLMLWPDQCVGVSPRCYSITQNQAIQATLSQLFDEIPTEATHIRVDCRADSLAISRTVYALADGFAVAGPTLALWGMTLVVVLLSSLLLCCGGCFYLCGSTKNKPRSPYVVAKPIVQAQGVYVRVNDQDDDEKQTLA